MQWLLDTAVFFTRNHCGVGWTHNMIQVSRLVNFLIFFAYFSIPVSLLIVWYELRRMKEMKVLYDVLTENRWIILMFVLFISFCGVTHLCDVLVFDWAPYRLYTLIDAMTAVLSIATAILLPKVSRRLIEALRKENP
jgi:hypothetical protein